MRFQQKNKIKNITIASIILGIILLSNVFSFCNTNSFLNQDNSFQTYDDEKFKLYSSFESDLSDVIFSGIGDQFKVRTYIKNESESQNSRDYFNISVPTSNMELSQGDFNFTFQNNFTTDYIIEDDSALYPNEHLENYQFDTSNFVFTNTTGHFLDSKSNTDMTDMSNTTYRTLQSSSNIVNYTIQANFPSVSPGRYNPFNRSKILSLISSMTFNITEDAILTIQMKNQSDSSWVNVSNDIALNSSNGIQSLNEITINENLNYIDSSDNCSVGFYYYSSQDFQLQIYEFTINSTVGIELNISSQEQVALEFDLRGVDAKTTVNGFYAWIRTLNITQASGETLNISLYRANATMIRTEANLKNASKIDPQTLIDSVIVPYIGDNLTYFAFDTQNTANLTHGNYFIVIKSDAPVGVFSLVALTYDQPGGDYNEDHKIEHQLKISSDGGTSWDKNTVKFNELYGSNTLDASSFKLNLTRGFIPSDINLKIQNTQLANDIAYFSGNIPGFQDEWGKGSWNNSFSPYISDITGNFQVNLTWNENITNTFLFNVSYLVDAFIKSSEDMNYEVKHDNRPVWTLNHTVDTNIPNWNFSEFWFIFPDDMTAQNLINPDYNDIFGSTEGGIEHIENNTLDKVMIPLNIMGSTINGVYSLNLTSSNYISNSNQLHSYINFAGTLWETKGFMIGDNISLGLDIQDHEEVAPSSGDANVSLYIDGVYEDSLTDSSGSISNNYLSYDFGNNTVLTIDNTITFPHKYYLSYFWTNGTAIGCSKSQIYIDEYSMNINDLNYRTIDDIIYNEIVSDFDLNGYYQDLSLLVASVNDTGIASKPEYPISISNINTEFTHLKDGTVPQIVRLNTFKQSENILNPGENVNYKMEIENLDDVANVSVKVRVQLVSYIQNNWIIAESYSSIQNLNDYPESDSKYEFDVDLTIPTLDGASKIWNGVNAPVRKSGAQTIVTIFIDENNAGTYENQEISMLVNQTENEFEGIILEVKESLDETVSPLVNILFERNECLYNHSGYNTTFIINYCTDYYTSSYNEIMNAFNMKLNSIFTNIVYTPTDIDDEEVFNVTSVLETEFGMVLSDKDVVCEYYNLTGWHTLGASQKTDQNGEVEFEIDIDQFVEEDFKLKLSWVGNSTINNGSIVIDVNREPSQASLSISFASSSQSVYTNSQNSIQIQIVNTGEKTLSLSTDNFSFVINEISGDLNPSYTGFNKYDLQVFKANDIILIMVKLDIPLTTLKEINLNITITSEFASTSSVITLAVQVPFIIDNFTGFITFGIIAALFLIWLASILYVRNTKNKISKSYKAPAEKERPRRGRYVKPSEIKPVKAPKTIAPTEVEVKMEVTPKKSTDLDSLLAEKGLGTKGAKPEITRAQLKKWSIDQLRDYCEENRIKYKKKDPKSELIHKVLEFNKILDRTSGKKR